MGTPAVEAIPLHHIDTETYNRIVACGALEDRSVELLDGLLVDVSPHSPTHASVIEELTRRLTGAQGRLRVQLPLEVPPDSVPEPDLALVAEAPGGSHPRTALFVAEVAVSSRKVDRTAKAALYARAGVPVYWLVDVKGRAVEVRTDPGPDGYRQSQIYREGAKLPSPAPGVEELDPAVLLAGAGSA